MGRNVTEGPRKKKLDEFWDDLEEEVDDFDDEDDDDDNEGDWEISDDEGF